MCVGVRWVNRRWVYNGTVCVVHHQSGNKHGNQKSRRQRAGVANRSACGTKLLPAWERNESKGRLFLAVSVSTVCSTGTTVCRCYPVEWLCFYSPYRHGFTSYQVCMYLKSKRGTLYCTVDTLARAIAGPLEERHTLVRPPPAAIPVPFVQGTVCSVRTCTVPVPVTIESLSTVPVWPEEGIC